MGDQGLISGLGRYPGEGNGKPTPVLLPGEFHGERSLAGYSSWSRKEMDMTEQLILGGKEIGVLPLIPACSVALKADPGGGAGIQDSQRTGSCGWSGSVQGSVQQVGVWSCRSLPALSWRGLAWERLFQVVLQSVQPNLGERLWLSSRSPTSTPEVRSRKQQEIQTSCLFFSSLPSKAKGLDDGECDLMESAQHWGV